MKEKKSASLRTLDNAWGYGFIILPFIGMLVFVVIPFCMTVYASFTSWPLGQAIGDAKWVGLRNYRDMFNNKLFWQSLSNTAYYMIGIPIGLALSVLLATAMNRGTRSEKVFRVIYYTPVITSLVAVTFIFQRMFMSDGGIINTFLMNLGIAEPPNWLGNPKYTKMVIIIMSIWKGLGSSTILYIAGMQGISSSYYEAARIDGANWFACFRKITLPLLVPVTFYLIITSVIGGAQMYVEPRLLFIDNGPANSTFTTVIHLYDRTFANAKAGYGSAVAVMLGVLVFVVTAIQFWINGRGDRIEKTKAR